MRRRAVILPSYDPHSMRCGGEQRRRRADRGLRPALRGPWYELKSSTMRCSATIRSWRAPPDADDSQVGFPSPDTAGGCGHSPTSPESQPCGRGVATRSRPRLRIFEELTRLRGGSAAHRRDGDAMRGSTLPRAMRRARGIHIAPDPGLPPCMEIEGGPPGGRGGATRNGERFIANAQPWPTTGCSDAAQLGGKSTSCGKRR